MSKLSIVSITIVIALWGSFLCFPRAHQLSSDQIAEVKENHSRYVNSLERASYLVEMLSLEESRNYAWRELKNELDNFNHFQVAAVTSPHSYVSFPGDEELAAEITASCENFCGSVRRFAETNPNSEFLPELRVMMLRFARNCQLPVREET
jgi:hypothetical protein